ncbi:hypothetical protein MTR67_034780 [Solanum verrucosum]|uniref:Uncharacterized protein n=1 Tax=Solanum verrucosum TaxID=315347 RepID=A0AAF0U8P7_SOLVR|nr:hypothetical protein MTR67_034780 [Solanum verrucosum]
MKIWESSNPFGDSLKGLILTFCSSVMSPERKDQIGGEKEQSACRRAILRSSTMTPNDPSTMSPNDPEHDYAEGWCKTAMNYTKGRIAELIGDSD